jgi:hypothetical protein
LNSVVEKIGYHYRNLGSQIIVRKDIIFAENLVAHDFDMVPDVPVAMGINAAGFIEGAHDLDADARVHEGGRFDPRGHWRFHVRFRRHERSLGEWGEKKSILAGSSRPSGRLSVLWQGQR